MLRKENCSWTLRYQLSINVCAVSLSVYMCVFVFIVSEALPDAVVSACSITVGSDHWAHYLFIGSSRHGDCGNHTERRGSVWALCRHTHTQAVNQGSWAAWRTYSNLWQISRSRKKLGRLKDRVLFEGMHSPLPAVFHAKLLDQDYVVIKNGGAISALNICKI